MKNLNCLLSGYSACVFEYMNGQMHVSAIHISLFAIMNIIENNTGIGQDRLFDKLNGCVQSDSLMQCY